MLRAIVDGQRYFHREYRGRRRRKDLVSTVSIEYSFIVLELPIRYIGEEF